MKRSLTLMALASAILFSFSSCEKIAAKFVDPFTVEVNVPLQIEPVSAGSDLKLAEAVETFNIDSVIKSHTGQLGINNVKSITPESASLTINNGADDQNHFGNLQSVKVKFSTGVNTTPAELFSYTFPDAATPILWQTLDADQSKFVLDYMKNTQQKYEVYGTLRRDITHQLTTTLVARFKVEF